MMNGKYALNRMRVLEREKNAKKEKYFFNKIGDLYNEIFDYLSAKQEGLDDINRVAKGVHTIQYVFIHRQLKKKDPKFFE